MSKADQVWSQMPMLRLRAMILTQSNGMKERATMMLGIFLCGPTSAPIPHDV